MKKIIFIVFSCCLSLYGQQQTNFITVSLPPFRGNQEGKTHKQHEKMYIDAIQELELYQATNKLVLSNLLIAQDSINNQLISTNVDSENSLKNLQDASIKNQKSIFKVQDMLRIGSKRINNYNHQLEWARFHLKLDDFRKKSGVTEWTDSRTTVGTSNAVVIKP